MCCLSRIPLVLIIPIGQTAVEHLEDEGLFDEEDEEDAGALAMCVLSALIPFRNLLRFDYSGDFADALGEDYLGLRALGIAAEFGMSSLSIPKKLLKGKKGQNKMSSIAYVPSVYPNLARNSSPGEQCEAIRTTSTIPAPAPIHPPQLCESR